MQRPHLCALFVVGLFIVPPVAAQSANSHGQPPASAGRLVPGCQDRVLVTSVRERCRWLVRFERPDTPRQRYIAIGKSADQKAIETALGELTSAQPAQIDGNRASVLAQRSSGEFTVVSLARHDQKWDVVAIVEPSEYLDRSSGKVRKTAAR
jgi:hypothetical protein